MENISMKRNMCAFILPLFVNPCPAEPGYTLFCKQCRSRSVGFWRSQLIWICTVCHQVCKFIAKILIKYSDWLNIRSGHGILIYSAGQGLNLGAYCYKRHKMLYSITSCYIGAYIILEATHMDVWPTTSFPDIRYLKACWVFLTGLHDLPPSGCKYFVILIKVKKVQYTFKRFFFFKVKMCKMSK